MRKQSHVGHQSSISNVSRRKLLQLASAAALGGGLGRNASALQARFDPSWQDSIRNGLDFLARTQNTRGQWNTQAHHVALAALAGTALICEGSTTTQGRYAKQIARCTDFLISKSRPNGLIGDPVSDNRYTYGHGFSMLMLSQILGEEGY